MPFPSWLMWTSRRSFLFLHFVSLAWLYMPNGVAWYFGNLAVYLNSYWYARLESSDFYSSWVISVFVIFWSGSLIVAGHLERKIDRRLLTFIGFFLFDTGIFISYFTMQYSQILFVLTIGVISGLGLGFLQSEAVSRIPRLVKKKTGLAFAILNNFFNIGAMFLQWLITKHANPCNMKTDTLVLGHYEVFSQKSVIDRVPCIFIVVGIVTCACHLTGLILTLALKDRGMISKSEMGTFDKKGKELTVFSEQVSLEPDFVCCNNVTVSQISGRNQTNSYETIQKKHANYQTVKSSLKSSDCGTYSSGDKMTHIVTQDISDCREDLTHCQMLQTMMFYVAWFIIFANDTTYVVILNFYKIFGQLWIHDDHFLTQMGMAALCTVLLMRILIGLLLDRYGVKSTQILLCCAMSLTLAFYYFTPQINRWLFFLCTCVVTGLCSSVYLSLPLMILELFGQTDFASKYGILTTSTVVLNLIAPQMFKTLLNHFGWFAVFVCPAAVNALAIIFNVLWLQSGH